MFCFMFKFAILNNLRMNFYGKKYTFQVANYGIGGHYDPHFDFARVI